MVWREPQNHHDDSYFCVVSIKGLNRYKKRKWEYPDLKSARRPVLHCENIPLSDSLHFFNFMIQIMKNHMH